MNDCVFCRIIDRSIPAEVLYEDESVLCILDIHPIHFGHTLIIPKRHCRDFLDLPDSSFRSILKAAQAVSNALVGEFGLEGFNLFSNNGRIAGQSVFHFHLHVTPRLAGDNIRFVLDLKHYAGSEMTELGSRLRARISQGTPSDRTSS
jgi:histidine triad (HIT) family protein